jgi:hypothetical protein
LKTYIITVAGVLVVDSRRPDWAFVVLVISPVRALVAGCGLLLLLVFLAHAVA